MNCIVNGLHISYSVSGDAGPVMLLLHGWGSNKEAFSGLSAYYANQGYTVVAVDLPGFGGSQLPQDAWGVHEYAEFIVAFIEKVGFSKITVLVGHSMGGRIALYLTGKMKFKAGKLILLGSHGFVESASFRSRAFKLIAKVGTFFTAILPESKQLYLQKKLYSLAGVSDYLQAGAMRETFKKVVAEDATAYAAEIELPTLLIYGVDDHQTPPEFGERFSKLIKDSSLFLIPEAGHYAFLDAPDQSIALIDEFLRR